MLNFIEATQGFEKWLGLQTPLVKADLVLKHVRFKQSKFYFLRGTYYRWSEVWPSVCPALTNAPMVLSIADLHCENFGTWRDSEGRLIWGVNDFDEAHPLPYTNDLTRLAVSARLASDEYQIDIKLKEITEAILNGYSEGLAAGGRPFVLAEADDWLRERVTVDDRDPQHYWEKLLALPEASFPLPEPARGALEALLPEPKLAYHLVRRVAGMGSLGQPRWVALADWRGGHIAREVKSAIPSGWQVATAAKPGEFYTTIVGRAVRAPDPLLHIGPGWIIRRLAPDCIKIEIDTLQKAGHFEKLLYFMGWETANIHLGDPNSDALKRDLKQRPSGWLREAANAMTDAIAADWDEWRKQ